MVTTAVINDGDRADKSYGVIVIGSTEPGVVAAVKSARMGVKTLLVSDKPYVGWMTGHGISQQDFNPSKTPAVLWGISREFHEDIAKGMPLRSLQYYWRNNGAAAPHVYQAAWGKLISHPNLKVLYSTKLVQTIKSGTYIAGVVLDTGDDGSSGTYTGQVFGCSHQTGALLRMSGASFSVGRESAAAFGESGAGTIASVALPGGNTIDPYITPGNSSSGLINGIDPGAEGAVGTGDGRVMQNGRRLYFASGADKIALPVPGAWYSPANYEFLGRSFAANPSYYTDIAKVLALYDIDGVGTAAGPTYLTHADINSAGPFSINYPNAAENLEYMTATPERQLVLDAKNLDHALGLPYWILTSNDSRIPAAIKTQMAAYGLSSQEFADTGGVSPEPYIRETPRLINDNIFTANQITASNGVTDPIAMFFYGTDSHYVRMLVSGGQVKAEGAILGPLSNLAYAARLSMKSLIPRASEVSNLVVGYGIAVTRKAWCSLRVAPSTMQVGEAQGAVMALCVLRKLKPAQITYAMLAEHLDLYRTKNGVYCDLTDPNAPGSLIVTGTWAATAASSIAPYPALGAYKSTGAGSTATAGRKPYLTTAGLRDVYFHYTPDDTVANGGQGRATNLSVKVLSDNGATTTTRTLNQLYNGAADHEDGRFYVGRFWMAAGRPSVDYAWVDTTGADDIVTAVGFSFVPVA